MLVCFPSTVTILRAALTRYLLDDPGDPDPLVAIGQAADELHAPAHVELAASRALVHCLGADGEYEVFTAAIDREMERRLDLDCWLADQRMGR